MQPGYPPPSGQDPYGQPQQPGQPQYGPDYGHVPPYPDPFGPQQPQPQPPQQPPPPVDPYAAPPYQGPPYQASPYEQQPYQQQPYQQQPYSPAYDPYAQQPTSGQPYAAQQYGYTVPPNVAYGGQPSTQNTLGLLALIFGILSIPLAFCCGLFSVPLGIAGVALGIVGIRKATQGQATNRGMALAGAICGGAGILLAILSTVLSFAITSDL
jgi:hypothetical protein